jgi:hypothetical protein
MATIDKALSRSFTKSAESLKKFAALQKEAARRFLDDAALDAVVKTAKSKKAR